MNSYCLFGAIGGCTDTYLIQTLNAGFHATALARTPSKLVDMLHAQGITIPSPTMMQAPLMQMSLRRPVTIDNPEICATATKNIIKALQEIYKAQSSTALNKPSITVISTTGVSDVKEDVPFAFRILYHVVLADPHNDKKEMERLTTEIAGNIGAFRGSVIVRPSLLTGDQSVKGGQGWEKLRVGREDEPAVGYTVHRADVGQWIFEQVVKTGGKVRFGERITLTN
ncbi:hypothetical protein BKA57DRAFT_527707 [Linnemannia elongata]|nr:hypothetical protein BKA57DRAFT_527707 [Linnemannia elongata]